MLPFPQPLKTDRRRSERVCDAERCRSYCPQAPWGCREGPAAASAGGGNGSGGLGLEIANEWGHLLGDRSKTQVEMPPAEDSRSPCSRAEECSDDPVLWGALEGRFAWAATHPRSSPLKVNAGLTPGKISATSLSCLWHVTQAVTTLAASQANSFLRTGPFPKALDQCLESSPRNPVILPSPSPLPAFASLSAFLPTDPLLSQSVLVLISFLCIKSF